MKARTIIGWRECIGLPDFGIEDIKAKVDTGARTSAIHAFRIKRFTKDGEDWVRFKIHPRQRRRKPEIECEAKVVDVRAVTSSNGQRERRVFIKTRLKVGPYLFPAEISLANRDEMGFRMLIGRQALKKRFIVDSSSSYTLGRGGGSTS